MREHEVLEIFLFCATWHVGSGTKPKNKEHELMNKIGDKRIILTNMVNFFYFLISNTPVSN